MVHIINIQNIMVWSCSIHTASIYIYDVDNATLHGFYVIGVPYFNCSMITTLVTFPLVYPILRFWLVFLVYVSSLLLGGG